MTPRSEWKLMQERRDLAKFFGVTVEDIIHAEIYLAVVDLDIEAAELALREVQDNERKEA